VVKDGTFYLVRNIPRDFFGYDLGNDAAFRQGVRRLAGPGTMKIPFPNYALALLQHVVSAGGRLFANKR
jgi:hypothetical protein